MSEIKETIDIDEEDWQRGYDAALAGLQTFKDQNLSFTVVLS